MPSAFLRRGCPAGRRRRMRSPSPRMTMSRLLKSCAIPPASLPTASIFCACRSWSSLCRSASSARLSSVRSTVRPRSCPGRPAVPGTTWTMSRSETTSPLARRARYSNSWSCPRARAARKAVMTRIRSSGWMRVVKKSGSSSHRSVGKPRTVRVRSLTKEKRRLVASASHTMASRPCTRSWKRFSNSLRAASRRSSSERSSMMRSSRASSCSSMRKVDVEGEITLRRARLYHLASAPHQPLRAHEVLEPASQRLLAPEEEGLEEGAVRREHAQVCGQHEKSGGYGGHDLLRVALEVEDGALLLDLIAEEGRALSLAPEAEEETGEGEREEASRKAGELGCLVEICEGFRAIYF